MNAGPTAARLAGDRLDPADLARVAANLEQVRARVVASGRDLASVEIVAVTKGFGLAAVRAALELGLSRIGENYAQELVAKAAGLARHEARPVAWHYLGAIQRNKLGLLAPIVARYESVDRLEEGERIARLAPGASVLVEVGFDRSGGRGGVAPEEVAALVDALRRLELRVDGLMAVAPPGGAERAAAAFAALVALAEELSLPERSIGMSGDYEIALSAGATTLRLGSALFGPRPGPPAGDEDLPQ